jgi:GNAT superfamily N-acetyltransferase
MSFRLVHREDRSRQVAHHDSSRVGRIEVRAADLEDVVALRALYAQLTDGLPSAAAGDSETSRAALKHVLTCAGRHLLVAVLDGRVVGTADLLIAPNITHRGTPWGIVENVVVASDLRRRGVGRALFTEITRIARANRCHKLMLLSGKHRVEAHNFYTALGYDPVCEGFKLYFDR